MSNSKDKQYSAFYPGKVWLDTKGERIQAHGGSIMYLDGYYYWYGENKEKTTRTGNPWHWGVRCYRSADLYNWEDMGLIIKPEPEDATSSLHPAAKMDRPHIIYNKKTKKFVCWMKIMNTNGTQTATIMTADRFLGPYTKVRERLQPLNMNAGDFDLAVAPDGKGYYFFERVHSETIIADLTGDYTDVTGYYSTHFPLKYPPYVREATAHFVRNSKHYLITSGTTGYMPNPSEVAVADTWHGPYRVLGNPHPEDKTKTSYHSQISSVFKVAGKKDLYIAVADRWMPEYSFLEYEDYADNFEAVFAPESGKKKDTTGICRKTEEANKRDGTDLPLDPSGYMDTSRADYVWLPLRFTEPDAQHPDGQVFIDWRDEWSLDEFEEM